MQKPVVMVSSTCYDLKQIRNSLEFFIKQLGYEPLLSESSSFPIKHSIGAIENCQNTVQNYADILILIIGGRYGYIDTKTKKSVTNLEYLEARRKGIPIYVFVDKKIWFLIDTYKKNPNADFKSDVEDVEVFNFIEQVRNHDSVWTHQFEHAKDITDILLIQFAYLFKSSLSDHKKLSSAQLNPIIKSLGENAFRLVIEKPDNWKIYLLYQIWKDEIDNNSQKIFQYKNNFKVGNWESIKLENALDWISLKHHELIGYFENAKQINGLLQKIYGDQEIPDIEIEIVMTARNIVSLLCSIIDWNQKCKVIKTKEPWAKVINAMIKEPKEIIEELISFPDKSLLDIEDKINAKKTDEILKINHTLDMKISNEEEYQKAFDEAVAYLNAQ